MKTQKYITSHRFRVKRAIDTCQRLPEKISIIDREAFVEFFLLEDLDRLYRYRYKKIKSKQKGTIEGAFYQKKQLEKIHYLIYMLTKCIDVMESKLDEASYTDVRRAIHERQLMVAANKEKYLDNLVKLVEIMLKNVDEEALDMAQKMLDGGDFMEELEAHDENARRVRGLPVFQPEEIEQVINPDSNINKKDKPKTNFN